MNPKLHSNKELSDYTVNDNFDFLTKAEAIKFFLEQNSASLRDNKMLVLYGDWGSGKTSLMRHIEKEISPIIYKPIFFQAWEHEKDENLALSLCDALIDCLDDKTSIMVKSFMKRALLTLKGFTNGITLKSSHLLEKFGLEFEFSGEKFNAAFDKEIENEPSPSFYFSNKEFKESFILIEKEILKKYDAQKLLIFVDDLDRCEPENVLNLITALKLFFTYGEQSVFFCGVDKEAITKAVKTKYKDVVKSDEYMEKVFDLAFNMPKTFSLIKMVEAHFPGDITLANNQTYKNALIVEDFFLSIRFTNPRHLKKVLNKYEIIKTFKTLSDIPSNIRELIPNIIQGDNKGNLFETIYCLFMVILYEFNINQFKEIEDYEQKMNQYAEVYRESRVQSGKVGSKNSIMHEIDNFFKITNIKGTSFDSIIKTNAASSASQHSYGFIKFIYIFSHSAPPSLSIINDGELFRYSQNFIDNSILTSFCKFLIKHHTTIISLDEGCSYNIWNLFEMVKYLL